MKTTISFSFDDGRRDNYTVVIPILKKYNLPATFNITTGYVDGSCPDNLKPTNKEAMTMDNVIEIADNEMFEIALHGNNHLNTIEDISKGREKLIDWLKLDNSRQFGFASPGSGLDINSSEYLNSDLFFAKGAITYIRTSLRNNTLIPIRVLMRKVARVIHFQSFYRIAYKDTLLDKHNGRILYSVPIMGDITVKQVIGLVKLAQKRKKSLILMFHSIEKQSSDAWSWNIDKFNKLCEYLVNEQNRSRLQVLKVEELYKVVK